MSDDYIGKLVAKKDGKRWILGMIVATASGTGKAYKVEWYTQDESKIYKKVFIEHDIKRMLATYQQKVYARINQREFV